MRYYSFTCISQTGFYLWFLLLLALPAVGVSAQDDLNVLDGWRRHAGAKNALYTEIAQQAYRALDSRDHSLSGLKTSKQWEAYIGSVRKRLRAAFGPFPERTPLNARVVGSFEENGIAVQLVTFESRPGFTVTGAFFKPAGGAERRPVLGMTVVPSALTRYDLPDLLGLLDSRRVLALDPVGGDGNSASTELREKTARTVNQLRRGAEDGFTVAVSGDAGPPEKILRDWLMAGEK